MFRFPRITYLAFSLLVVSSSFIFVTAQDDKSITSEPAVSAVPMITTARADGEDEDKITGATLRGRIIYEDSGRPVRYALVSLVRDEKEKRPDGFYSGYSAKHVKTDENGEFVIRNVGAGSYYPLVKFEGILNRNSYRIIEWKILNPI